MQDALKSLRLSGVRLWVLTTLDSIVKDRKDN